MNFKKRSNLPELMDDPNLPEDQLRLALKDIALVNKYLGGNWITIKALENLIELYPQKKEWKIVDVGCGDGEVLRQIATHFQKVDIIIKFVGIDISAKSISRARRKSEDLKNISFEAQDIILLDRTTFTCDVILCTLTMHHFTDVEILKFVEKFRKLTTIGFIINDLERSKIAYRLFQLFSSIFMKSNVAKYDGKVSIARSFKREDLENYSKQLSLTNYSITWKWAFRFLWIIKTL